ncbi:hypothetical protein [Dyadobacter crusticola]|uniref:hypothetical protein n=1 Tax=Dyadobacter crusticola TaxID=292407 RepID=UPI0004E2407E|nr:hypothetical protein [Dyadobacter crusticola]
MKRFLIVFAFILLFVALTNDTWAQCAMCRGSVESSMGNGRNNVGVGLNTGIMYLFVMPYLLVAAIGYFWYKSSKRAREERQFVTSRVKQAFQ